MHTKTVQTKFGDKNVYHCEVGGQPINLGFKKVVEEGETVTLTVDRKYGGLQYVSHGGNAPAKPASNFGGQSGAAASTTTTVGFPVAKNSREVSIIRQSSLNRAVDVTHNMVSHELFKPATEQEYLDKIVELAYMFTEFSTGHREVNQAKAMQAYEENN